MVSFLFGCHTKGTSTSEIAVPAIFSSADQQDIQTWENARKPQLLDLFEKNVYGKFDDSGIQVSYQLTDQDPSALCGKAIRKNVKMFFVKDTDSVAVDLLIYLPKKAQHQAVPLFLGLNFFGNHTIHFDPNIPLTNSPVNNKAEFCINNNKVTELSRGVRAYRWPVERLIDRGYGLATIYYGDLDPDFDDGFKNGLHKLSGPNDLNSSISAWAYGLSEAMNYFEIDDQINPHQIAVLGHSRLGKAALWAGANDPRFALVISNDSGCGGAALSRRKKGETFSDINHSFPHWFCKKFHQYNDKEELLPVDQHMLIACIAPRPIYIASAQKDQWADPEGEFLSLKYASQVYRLWNTETMGNQIFPAVNQPIWKANMAYHIRSGAHDITRYDWEQYLNFADRCFAHK